MILEYSVRNFYSIGNKVNTIRFTVDGNAPKKSTYTPHSDVAGRVSTLLTIVGPNAAGKTRLLQVVPFIQYIITETLTTMRPDEGIQYEPHRGYRDDSSEISVKFTVAKRVFKYHIVFNEDVILKEILKEYSRSDTRITGKTIASRSWDPETERYSMNTKSIGLSSRNELRKNASMIASAMQKDSPNDTIQLIYKYWEDGVVVHNLNSMGNAEDSSTRHEDYIKDLIDGDKTLIKDKVEQELARLDIGFDNLFARKIEKPDGDEISFYGVMHKYKDTQFATLIHEESSGTKRLIRIVGSVIEALAYESGGIAIIDEIDAFLDPEVVEALVELFIHPESNPNQAQLLISTHSHRILNLLDKQQLVIACKDETGETISWRLDEDRSVKQSENLYVKFITNAYGGRPNIGPM